MRFLIDESVGVHIVRYLRSSGHDVVYISEVAAGALDEDVLKKAAEETRILITNDKDFGDLVFRSGQPHHGVLLFRLKDESAANQVKVLTSLLEQYSDHIVGQFATVQEHRMRVSGGMTFRLTQDSDEE
jgi:predicted nuclease of predicted toxin-antitoxin system